jgi:hypothetical protein
MKLTKETLAILKNFASINGNIRVQEGSYLKTISVARNVFATATISETFPKEFCLYDLGGFLNCVTLFDDEANLEFGDNAVLITTNNTKIEYRYSSPNIVVYPEHDPDFSDAPDVEFSLTADELAKLNKGAAAVNGDTIKIATKGSEVVLEALDNGTTVNTFKMAVSVDKDLPDGEFYLKRSNMGFMADGYEIYLWKDKFSKFVGSTIPVTYFVSLEKQ